MFMYSYCYVCSVLCILFYCVVLCIVCVYTHKRIARLTLNYVTTISFRVPSNLLFTVHSAVPCHVVWATDSNVKSRIIKITHKETSRHVVSWLKTARSRRLTKEVRVPAKTNAGFVVDEVAVEQVCLQLRLLQFSPVRVIPQILHNSHSFMYHRRCIILVNEAIVQRSNSFSFRHGCKDMGLREVSEQHPHFNHSRKRGIRK